jgi:hypothetical protein
MEEFSWIYDRKVVETPRQRVFGSQSAMSGRTGDPSMVSLSVGEMRRLVDIEISAQLALDAMSSITRPNKGVTDAAHALANALASPVLHGG